MAYELGIDLGTSCTVAAVSRADTGVEVVALRGDTPGVPTVLHIADDATMLVGAAAEPLMLSDPGRVFRGFLHRLNEPSPPDPLRSPATLTARLVHWIVEAVTEREGELPRQITLAHPAGWGADERGVLQNALIQFGLAGVVLVPAPLAAAVAYAAEAGATSVAGVAAGEVLAVYDLGATCCVSLVRCAGADLAVLGEPQVLADGGGARFDELVLAHVLDELGDQVAAADLDDQTMLAGMAALLTDCVLAREALTTRSVVSIPVSLPGLDAQVRLTGAELERLVDSTLRTTVNSVRVAISMAGLHPAEVGKVLVTGGCAGMPAVTRLLSAELGRPFVVLTDPESATARGAALMAARPAHHRPVVVQPPPMPAVPNDLPDVLPAETVRIPRVPARRPTAERHFRPRRGVLLAAAAGVLSVTTVILPLTLWRAPDSGAASSAAPDRDPRRGEPVPAYESTTATPASAGTGSTTTADLPASPARLSARGPTASRPAPQSLSATPPPAGATPAPNPRTTTRPRTTMPPRPEPSTTTSSTPPSSEPSTTTTSTPPTSEPSTTSSPTSPPPPPNPSSPTPPRPPRPHPQIDDSRSATFAFPQEGSPQEWSP